MLMVKPAGPYLDVIARLADRTLAPIAAYQVSAASTRCSRPAAAAGALDRGRRCSRASSAIRRAGADIVISYFATRGREVARR